MYEIKLLKDAIDKLKPGCLDDIVDKAHYIGTTGLLFVLGLILSSKQIFGEPITCMVPPEFPKFWASYVNDYCFATSTYVLDSAAEIMPQDEILPPGELKYDVSYYQWVPYVLVIQGLFFYAPHLFWSLFQKTQTDVDFKHLVGKCMKSRVMPMEKREGEIDDVVENIVKTYEHRQVKENASGLGTAGMKAYLISKLLNVVNVAVQLFMLYIFIGRNGWGTELIDNSMHAMDGVYRNKTGFFPHVSFCTFKQNVLGSVDPQLHTVQCVLMMNMLNEKIFSLLYIWFVVLLFASVLNAFYTFARYVFPIGQRHCAKRYLDVHPHKNRIEWRKFADYQLDYDGLLLLRFIENTAGFLIASEVACKFYDSLRKSTSFVDRRFMTYSEKSKGKNPKL